MRAGLSLEPGIESGDGVRGRSGFRFIQEDIQNNGSSSDPISLHKSLYAGGNPVMNNDRSGHDFGIDTAFAANLGRSIDVGGGAFAAAYGRMLGLDVKEMDPFASGLKELITPLIQWLNDRPPGAAEGGETLIPVYGSLKNAMAYFADGRYGWGATYAVQTIADLFLVRSVFNAGTSLVKFSVDVLAQDVALVSEQEAARAGSLLGSFATEQATVLDAAGGDGALETAYGRVFPDTFQGGPSARWIHEGDGLWQLRATGADRIVGSRFGTVYRSASDGLWWSADKAGHGGSAFKVFKETGNGLEWYRDADRFGNFIAGKHKGPTGLFIPWEQTWGIK